MSVVKTRRPKELDFIDGQYSSVDAIGDIFVSHIDNLFEKHKEEIEKEGENISYERLQEILFDNLQ